MNILNICENVDILKAFRIIKIVIQIIKIIVPILLIISCSISAAKAVASSDEKANKKMFDEFKRKLVAAAIIFLVPTFIGVISNLSSGGYLKALECIKNANSETILRLATEEAETYIAKAKKTLDRSDLYNARQAISKIDDVDKYNAYAKQLAEIEKTITAKEEEARRQRQGTIDTTTTQSLDKGYWWPVGSSTTSTINGKTFATGTPSATRITATFGGNDSVHQGLGGGHGALDIGAPRGSNVIATKSGTVLSPKAGERIDYPDQAIKPDANGKYNCSGLKGNEVVIDHGNGMVVRYAHLYKNTITVRAGDHVEQGQVIALSGSSGCSTGPHLHFQMELNGRRVDPQKYISASNPRP